MIRIRIKQKLKNIQMSARVQALFEANIRKVTRAYEEGMELQKIARRVGVSPPTITKWLTREGYRHKRRGRYPQAMKARTRDLSRRGWSDERIAKLLKVPRERVVEWSSLEENPILGGERDPLKVRGEPVKKSGKSQSKLRQYDPEYEYIKGRWRKKRKKRRKGEPPPRHKCRKHWTDEEKAYVLALMDRGLRVIEIYKRMRASRKRQLKIWREAGRKGFPPGFGKEPPTRPPKPRPPTAPVAEEALEELRREEALLAAQRAEIEARIDAERKAIKKAKDEQKKVAAELRREAQQLHEERARVEAIAAWAEKRRPVAPPKRRKPKIVEEGSYEAEVLGLPVGSKVPLPPKPKKKRVRKKVPTEITEWADNKRYFVVSSEWPELRKVRNPDELQVIAEVMTIHGFPSRAEAVGKEPQAYLTGNWGVRRGKRWERAKLASLEVLAAYTAQKKKLAAIRRYDDGTAAYLVAAAKAARKPTQQNIEARNEAWGKLGIVGQLIARMNFGVADAQGQITPKGMARVSAAAHILESATAEKEAKRARRELEKKKREERKAKRAVADKEREERKEKAEEELEKLREKAGKLRRKRFGKKMIE